MAKTKKELTIIEKIVAPFKESNKITISCPIGGGENVDFTAFNTISLEDTISFVETVSDSLFNFPLTDLKTGEIKNIIEYNPAIYDVAFAKTLLSYYTDLDLNISNEDFISSMYVCNLPDRVIENINTKQLDDIIASIQAKIRFKREELLSDKTSKLNELKNRIEKEQDEILTQTEEISNSFETVLENFKTQFEGVTPDMMNGLIKNMSGMNERELANNVLDFKKENGEI